MEKLLSAATNTVNVVVTPPTFLNQIAKNGGLGNLIGWGLRMIFIVAGIVVLYQIILGAFEWVQSAGEKEKLEKARKQITSSITGLVILFAVIAIVVVIEQIFGIGLGISLPIAFTKIGYSN